MFLKVGYVFLKKEKLIANQNLWNRILKLGRFQKDDLVIAHVFAIKKWLDMLTLLSHRPCQKNLQLFFVIF